MATDLSSHSSYHLHRIACGLALHSLRVVSFCLACTLRQRAALFCQGDIRRLFSLYGRRADKLFPAVSHFVPLPRHVQRGGAHPQHHNADSYISTFTTLTLLMGVVFQLPVVAYVLGKLGIINAQMLARYRKHTFLVIMTVAAIITPGQDILTLSLVTMPLYLLYEVSIRVVKE